MERAGIVYYFMYNWSIDHFHITSSLTASCVFLYLRTLDDAYYKERAHH